MQSGTLHAVDLYPPLHPYDEGMLDVGDGHRIHWTTSGAADGKPVVVLHGGPGTGSAPMARQHFAPEVYRIVQFDQRGCGRSTPSVASSADGLRANTTWHLIADMERLRERLGIERWQIFGGSWGATLGLAYAQAHPDRVTELVLRGVFTARRAELDWVYNGGAAHLFPAEWAEFLALLPADQRHDPLGAYARLVNGADTDLAHRAAVAWSAWEGAIVSLLPSAAMRAQYADPALALPFARIALHYFTNGAWLENGQLIRDAGKLGGIPGVIVQGRYDAVCPPSTAYALHRAWPESRLVLVNNSGHAVTDPGILHHLRMATDEFAGR